MRPPVYSNGVRADGLSERRYRKSSRRSVDVETPFRQLTVAVLMNAARVWRLAFRSTLNRKARFNHRPGINQRGANLLLHRPAGTQSGRGSARSAADRRRLRQKYADPCVGTLARGCSQVGDAHFVRQSTWPGSPRFAVPAIDRCLCTDGCQAFYVRSRPARRVSYSSSRAFRPRFDPGLMFAPPLTYLLQHRRERHAIW